MTKTELDRFRAILTARVAELERVTRHRDAIRIERSADELEEIQAASQRALAVKRIHAWWPTKAHGDQTICVVQSEPLHRTTATKVSAIPSSKLSGRRASGVIASWQPMKVASRLWRAVQ
jgi:hypothetical protein